MKVVMIGHSSVGKTTYMASMYSELQNPVNGLALRAKRRVDHNGLLHMHAKLASGEYPGPSDQRAEYDFVLTYEDEDFFPFQWLDYRGGALGEHRSGDQTKQLVDDLQDADGILVFCDCQQLARGPAAARPIGRITTLLGQALTSLERPVPLGIVLTKADLVDEIDAEVRAPLQGLISAITASERLLGTIIPIACGREPMNVQVPVLYILHCGISLMASFMDALVEHHRERQKNFQQRSGFLDDLTSAILGERTYRELAAAELAQMEEINEQLDILREPAEALEAYLEGLETF
jgi:hypothetical protein